MMKKIIEELRKRTQDFTKECEITMKVDGEKVYIKPCNYTGTPEYFLIRSFESNGFDTIEKVANYIMNYEKNKKAHNDGIAEITKYFKENIVNETGDWDWYSDWHKDVFGFRPRGRYTCGNIIFDGHEYHEVT